MYAPFDEGMGLPTDGIIVGTEDGGTTRIAEIARSKMRYLWLAVRRTLTRSRDWARRSTPSSSFAARGSTKSVRDSTASVRGSVNERGTFVAAGGVDVWKYQIPCAAAGRDNNARTMLSTNVSAKWRAWPCCTPFRTILPGPCPRRFCC